MSSDPTKRREAFVDHIVSRIRNREARESTRKEILDHLLESESAFLDEGLSADAALDRAIAAFGDPVTIGASLRATHRPFYLRAEFLAFFLPFAFLVSALGLTEHVTEHYSRHSVHRQQVVASGLDRFFADARALPDFFQVERRPKTRDAGAWLNSRIPWDAGSWKAVLNPDGKKLELDFPDSLYRELAKRNWITTPALRVSSRARSISVDWLKKMRGYDYWDPYANSPVEVVLRSPDFALMTAPIPQYSALTGAIRLRLIDGLMGFAPLEALQETRHFAGLVLTNEWTVAPLVALSWLKDEEEAFEEMVRAGILPRTAWKPIPREVREKAKNLYWGSTALFDFYSPVETWQKVIAERPVGMCAGFLESVTRAYLLRAFLTPQAPFERDFRPQLAAMEYAFRETKGICRIAPARVQWGRPDFPLKPEHIYGTYPPSRLHRMVLALGNFPYARRALASYFDGKIEAGYHRYWGDLREKPKR